MNGENTQGLSKGNFTIKKRTISSFTQPFLVSDLFQFLFFCWDTGEDILKNVEIQ